MRNRRKTIESLKRLVERPGTAAEGETARRLLAAMEGHVEPPNPPFNIADFPIGTRIFYNYWAYDWNCAGTVAGFSRITNRGEQWMRIKFDHLKTTRAVPVTSDKGTHISKTPLNYADAEYLVFTDGVAWRGWGDDTAA